MSEQALNESFESGIERLTEDESMLKVLDLSQLQRQHSIVFASAQKHVAELEHLLLNVSSGWVKQLSKPAALQPAPSGPTTPQAYRFKDIYEQRKRQQQQKCLEQERAQREFHSRPMPNFRQVHQQLLTKQVAHQFTCPITPNVLKKSLQLQCKRREQIEQQQQAQQSEQKSRPQPKSARMAAALLPLQPSNAPMRHLEVKPFRFSTELRAEQRKLFNVKAQQLLEQRRCDLDQQRKRAEEEEYQKQRQLSNFKARPNPFKNQFQAVASAQ